MELDIVVLGATGFTGKLAVECLAKWSDPGVTWLIAARSKQKISELVDKLMDKGVDISQVPTAIVDVNDEGSLGSTVRQARVVLNCVGPNTEMSGPIVEACIKNNTHYIDISAEIHHIFNLYVKYNKTAEDTNVLVIPSCGFASLVAASGLLYLKQHFEGTLNSAECYVELLIPKRTYIPLPGNALASYGTWESTVHVFRNMKEYQRVKDETFPPLELPQEMKRNFFHCRHGKLWFPYPGPDQDVLQMSERYLLEKKQKRPVHVKVYTKMPIFIHYLIIPAIFLYYYLSYFKWFSNLLWKFPRLFTLGYMSHKGPSEKIREGTKYSFTYIGKGWDRSVEDYSKPPNKKLKIKVSSNDPYKISAIVMIIAAVTVLKEPSKIPRGGVVNVGAAFSDTAIVERMSNNGLKYEVLPNT